MARYSVPLRRALAVGRRMSRVAARHPRPREPGAAVRRPRQASAPRTRRPSVAHLARWPQCDLFPMAALVSRPAGSPAGVDDAEVPGRQDGRLPAGDVELALDPADTGPR